MVVAAAIMAIAPKKAMRAGEMDDSDLALLLMKEASPIIPGLDQLWNGLMIKNAWPHELKPHV